MILPNEKQVTSLALSQRLKGVVGYEDLYNVSDEGEVFGKKGKLSPNLKKGYATVTLARKRVLNTQFVHRIVAKAFVPNPLNLPQVNHIDGNKTNNKVSNLEWCDQSHNQVHARKLGLMGGEKQNTAKLSVQQVQEIRERFENGDISKRQLSAIYGVGESTIGKIIRREYWKYV